MHLLRIDFGSASQSGGTPIAATVPKRNPFALGLEIASNASRRIATVLREELRVRRDMRRLTAMSDHMLKDIGLDRADIGHAVRYGRD